MHRPIELVNVEGEPLKLSMEDKYRSKVTTFAYNYLQNLGWFDEEICDNEGYTPWYTYPAIAFLKDILTKDDRVLEYGAGYSSLFYNRYVGYLTSIDHDLEWAQKIANKDPTIRIEVATESTKIHLDAIEHVKQFIYTFPQIRSDDIQHDLMHGLANHEYAGYASQIFYKEKGFYNIVVIDGMARALCAYLAVQQLNDDAYIILDNSDRWQYNNIHKFLIENGYGRLDFWGPGNQALNAWCTSIFSKKFPFKNTKILREERGDKITL